jgi:hypothetical protein
MEMSLRRLSVAVLGAIGIGILVLIALLSWFETMSAKESAGWALAGFMALREVVSKLENVALNIRSGSVEEVE